MHKVVDIGQVITKPALAARKSFQTVAPRTADAIWIGECGLDVLSSRLQQLRLASTQQDVV
jgi:hypothetical protein